MRQIPSHLQSVFVRRERVSPSGGLQRGIRMTGFGVLCGLVMWSAGAVSKGESQQQITAPDPAAIFRSAKQALQAGDLRVAEDGFREVIALDPRSAAAYVNLAVAYMREKRWDDALIPLEKAKALSPSEPGIPLNLGLTYYRRSDFYAAIAPLSSSLQLAPDSRQARYLLGLCFFFTNRYKEASETLGPLWGAEATNLNYLYVLSIAASKAGDGALQQKAFQQMLSVGQNTPEFHLYIGKAYLAEENLEKALNEFQAAAAARPDLPLVHYFLGRVFMQQRDYAHAAIEFQKDMTIEPDFAYNYEELAMMEVNQGRAAAAEQHFQRAVERNNALVNSYFGLAKIYREAGRYHEALDMLDHAEKLAPQSASVHFTRGQVLVRSGRSSEGQQELETAAKLLKSFNDRLQSDPQGNQSADAQEAAQQ